jgi:hypothetical protein
MYILVQHTIADPADVWPRVQQSGQHVPAHLTLHQSMPTADGSHAICIWEAQSIDVLKTFLDPFMGPAVRNEYFEVVNKEGVALPTGLQLT